MYLTPGQSLEVKLAGAAAITELPVTAAFFEGATASMDASAWGAPTTVTAGAVAVTAVADPGAGKMRQVKHLTVANVDTAPAIVTVQVNDGGTPRVLKTITLAVGYSLEFTDTDGFRVLDTNGAVMGVGATGPAGPAGAPDDWVAFAFGTASPLFLKALAGGDVVEFAQVVVEVAFDDPAATIQVGTVGVPTAMLAAADTDMTTVGQYGTYGIYLVPGAETLQMAISPGASSVGSGHILFRVR